MSEENVATVRLIYASLTRGGDGLVVYFKVDWDRDEALEAAGLSE